MPDIVVILTRGSKRLGIVHLIVARHWKSSSFLPLSPKLVGEHFSIAPNWCLEVVLNEELQTIGHGEFIGCISLDSVVLPSSVTEIGDNTFSDCTKLKEVVLNEGIQTIVRGAFYRCSSLERVVIPSTVAKVGDNAFLSWASS
eukprot:CAMPEP_0172312338 /NCGR_PEP_ID=MMETSP1058-20130122/17137_1 /TAXON_ID=83371 /ORGANISM="Detonula confervacea, Strain CCMP 353" /LENGTH=142 /DNA_ID=CAMNT_0013025755 /DNA_START=19 /DNA_END=447 /DNA_ORIENTATION=-